MRILLMAAVVFTMGCGGVAERDAPAAAAGNEATPEQWAGAEAVAPAEPAITETNEVAAVSAPQVTPAPAAPQNIAAQPVILDVRTPEEYAEGHVVGTFHIPLDQLEARWQELAQYRGQPVVVYCRTGRRSAAAIDLLATKGFSRLENGGGVSEMARRGLRMSPEGCC
jgi:phage shock protein E